MTIPTFKTQEHEDEFVLLFEQRAQIYVTLMNKVKNLMYGTGHGNYANLPGSCQEIIRDITGSLLYDVEYEFEQSHPEYKKDDELFIPRKTFKEDVEEALLHANQKFWNGANECPPCDDWRQRD
jgi:hypothetical protein